MSGLTVQLDFSATPAEKDTAVAMWTTLASEMAEMVPTCETAELVVTDQFAKVVGELEAGVPHEHGGDGKPAEYDPNKPDGSMAGARTLPLHDRTVVVVNARTAVFGIAGARRIVHHETQHVVLRQMHDTAWLMHRRAPFTRPPGFGFDYVCLAQSMIDEYRCEAALSVQVATSSSELQETPDGYGEIADLFVSAREQFDASGDLAAAYSDVLRALDRLSAYVAYAAGSVARGDSSTADWSVIVPAALALPALTAIPPAGARRGYDVLRKDVAGLVAVIDSIGQHLGFRIGIDEQEEATFLYFV